MLLVLLNIIFLVSIVTAGPSLECGEKAYDPSKEKCCGLTISSTKDIEYPRCCGEKLYDVAIDICCIGNLQSLSSMDLPSCCGSKAYDMKAQGCCQEVLYDPATKECKDSTTVVARSALISIDKATEKCGKDKTYSISTQKCCSGTVQEAEGMFVPECCGTSLFEAEEGLCCGETASGLPDNIVNPDCCGTSVYDRAFKICCDKALSDISKMALPKCCGSKAYDSATHVCFESGIYSKDLHGGCGEKNTLRLFKYQLHASPNIVNSLHECDAMCAGYYGCWYWATNDYGNNKFGQCYLYAEGAYRHFANKFTTGYRACTYKK